MASFTLDLRGDFACFSRPELSVERFSYPCPTPSAARNIFDAIYLKPGKFRWAVQRIEVLHPVSYLPLRRNEVKDVVNEAAVRKWMQAKPVEPILADADKALTGSDERGRTQRQTMALRDVRYRITAGIRPWPGFDRESMAFDQQFLRRVRAGKCFQQPYLGCREFVAYFRLADDCEDRPDPVDFTQDLGWMLFDVFDLSRPQPRGTAKPAVSVFRAKLERGVLDVPPYDDPRVRKGVSPGGKEAA